MLQLVFSNAALACSQFIFTEDDTVVLMRGVANLGLERLNCKVISLDHCASNEDGAKLLMDLIESSSSVRSYY